MTNPALALSDRPFHVLALSGGGFRGLYAASVLAVLEKNLGAPLASRFDLICGTSVGGLLALGLAAEIPATQLQSIFERDGRRIFCSRGLLRRLFGFWLASKHSPKGLKTVVVERFGDLTMGNLKHNAMVPAVNYSTGRGKFFKTPHSDRFSQDVDVKLVDVALATTAAPTYFPLHRIDRLGVFADGGLFGNTPGLFGLHEACTVFGANEKSVRVLAIGTMNPGASFGASSYLDRGFALWNSKVFDLTISAQEGSVHNMLEHRLQDRFFSINDTPHAEEVPELALDRVSEKSIRILRDRGHAAAAAALGRAEFRPFRLHSGRSTTVTTEPNESEARAC